MTFLGSVNQPAGDAQAINLGKKIAVLVISGPANTGKSFLANQIVGSASGFKVRSQMPGSSGTVGIWIWNQLIPVCSEFDALILDCQGLNDDNSHPDVDLKLLAISMLLSSQFVFNTVGLISDDSLNLLSIVQLLTTQIRIDT